MQKLVVNLSNEYRKIEALRVAQERTIASQFMLYIKRSTQPEIVQKIEAGDNFTIGKLQEIFPLIENYIDQLSNVLQHVYLNAANAEADVWLKRLGIVVKQAEFDVTDEEVTSFLRTSRRNFIQNMSRQQRLAIMRSVIAGVNQGKTPKQIARMFVNSIGLTPQQVESVLNYRRALERNSTEALMRELRNPRYDERIQQAIDEDRHLRASEIERMTNAYARNLQRHRALVIAQTESLRMVNEARNRAVRQAARTAGVDVKRGTKTWQTTLDGRERPSHNALHGQTVPIDEPFTSPSGAQLMFPGDTSLGAGAAEVVNCRCAVVYNFEE